MNAMADEFNAEMNGLKTMKKRWRGRALHRVVACGRRIAMDFGASSPRTMCRKVITEKAIVKDTVAITAG
jgi:hypothetical protein